MSDGERILRDVHIIRIVAAAANQTGRMLPGRNMMMKQRKIIWILMQKLL